MEEFVNAISTVGFPIAAFCGIFYLYDKTIKDVVNTLDNVNQTLNSVNATLDEIAKRLENVE